MRVYFLFTCLPTTQSRADDATGSVAAAGETLGSSYISQRVTFVFMLLVLFVCAVWFLIHFILLVFCIMLSISSAVTMSFCLS